MGSETAWGFGSLVLIVGFIAFAIYQGTKVRRPPQGVPPDRSHDLTSMDIR
jgi:hypothetical protein